MTELVSVREEMLAWISLALGPSLESLFTQLLDNNVLMKGIEKAKSVYWHMELNGIQ